MFSVCITSVLNIIIKQKLNLNLIYQLNVLQRDSLLHQLVPEIVENAIYFGTVSRELGRLPVVPVGREVGANRPGVATERPLPTAVRTPAFRPQLVHAVHTAFQKFTSGCSKAVVGHLDAALGVVEAVVRNDHAKILSFRVLSPTLSYAHFHFLFLFTNCSIIIFFTSIYD